MRRTRIPMILASAFALAAASSLAGDTGTPGASASFMEQAKRLVKSDFSKADKDNDGTLDREEAKALPAIAAHFDAIDADHDGTVSRDEMKVYEKFARNDKDADGSLNKKEARWWWTVSRHFDAIDADKDGTVSLAEINAYMMARKSRSADAR